jgi:hypothetical protein
MDDRPSPWPALLVLAAFAGGIAVAACLVWRQRVYEGNDPTDLAAPVLPWPAEHALLSGLIVATAVLVLGRVAVWARNVEAGSVAARDRSDERLRHP